MLRIAFIELLLFALPFVAWAVYAAVTRRQRLETIMAEAPMPWLLIAGLGMVIIGLAGFASFSSDPADKGRYVPPVYEDGRIVPGHVEPAGD